MQVDSEEIYRNHACGRRI